MSLPVYIKRINSTGGPGMFPEIEIICTFAKREAPQVDFLYEALVKHGLYNREPILLGGVDPVERDARWTAALAKALGGATNAIESVLAAFNNSGG